jgi:Rac GTPase-activating protein 1
MLIYFQLFSFLCVRCRNVIEPDSNLLLLSDGNLLCQNCSQVCSICNLPITDEAVMIGLLNLIYSSRKFLTKLCLGDQSYHSSCFKCTNCKNKIDGTLLARTSDVGFYFRIDKNIC